MLYATFKAGPWSKAGKLARILSFFLPKANPDFEEAYQRTVTWWLEVDEKNVVQRELAFDVSGNAVAAAPIGPNHGIFTDLNSAPNNIEVGIAAVEFERQWAAFELGWFNSHGTSIDANVLFPLSVTLNNGELDTYSSITNLVCNLEDFEPGDGKVQDAKGRAVSLKIEVLEVKELRLV